MRARHHPTPPPTRPTFHGSLGFRLHKLFLFDKASTISCSRGRGRVYGVKRSGTRAPTTHPQLEPLTLGPSFGNSEAPAGSFEPSLRYQMIPKGSNFQDSCSTSPRHLVVGNVEKCWNPGKGGGWEGARTPLLVPRRARFSLRFVCLCTFADSRVFGGAERILKVTNKSENRERCRKLSL